MNFCLLNEHSPRFGAFLFSGINFFLMWYLLNNILSQLCDSGSVYRLSLFLSVLEVCAPVFIVAGIGFFWKKSGYEYRIEFVTQLVMSLTIPCLIFNALTQTQIDFEILKTLLYATLTVLALIVAATYVIVVILGLKRQTFLAPMIFGNSANIGIPICY
jgi:Predicted permeases